MQKLSENSGKYAINKLADGEENMISFEAGRSNKLVRFFGIIHNREGAEGYEDGVYLTGEYEFMPWIKSLAGAIIGILLVIAAIYCGWQYAIMDVVAQSGGINPSLLHIIICAVAVVVAIVIVAVVMWLIWRKESVSFDEIAAEVQRAAEKKLK
jgi:ABC-type Mn2+/Zn2+ transport system permease subunit